MSDAITAAVLGVVEGLTEMLPVSSTAHLIIANRWFSFDESFTKIFDVAIQSGAILAVLVYFWRTLWPWGSKDTPARNATWREWGLILIAVLPILVLGAIFGDDILDNLFDQIFVIALALIINGILLLVAEYRQSRARVLTPVIGAKEAVMIGLAHAFALIPGMSRSASATIGGMFLGIERDAVAKFSMMLGIPTLGAATAFALLQLRGAGMVFGGEHLFSLAIGFIVSGLVCYGIVSWFFSFIRRYTLRPFGYYRIVLGIALIVFFVL